ncbi:MAG: SprB repeat-containing protein [Bacteroidetes bacterium]|nr:SprB repeat-containing protein [Bacteroidota bacterium]
MAPGAYYLQVSGGNLNDQCAFTLALQNNFDCAGCVIQSSFTASPPPVNGTYQASQTVTFCYTITDYNQTSINWLHGIVPTFSAGWDMSTLVTNPPVSCSGQGTWSWYNNNVVSTATGQVHGPGFYFESQLGNAGGVLDGNPGNNFGDNNPNNGCDWTFCWTVTTLPPNQCVPGTSLNIGVDTYGDGESGSWTSLACVGDPVSDFFATLTCCASPLVAITDPTCPGQNNGSVIGTGQGSAPWDYIWKNNAGVTIQTANNVNGSNTINNLAPGNYTLTAVDNGGCSSVINFVITAPVAIVLNTVPVAVTCNAGTNGSATVNVVGGAIPYQYLWAPSGGTGSSANTLTAGTYTVTVTDANGCTASTQIVIQQPNPIILNIVAVDANCGASNGSLTVNVNGGIGVLQYSNNGGVSFQAGNVFTNLASGNYNIVVRDVNGCQTLVVGQVNSISGPIINSAPFTNVSCNGNSNGSITVNTSGGTGALQYSIDNGATFQASNSFNNLPQGNYSIVVEDGAGCQATLNIIITEPPLLTISTVLNIPICGLNNGSITASSLGGVNPKQYSINGGPSQASGLFQNLGPGNYTVTVTDFNNCTASVLVAVIADPPLNINAVPSNSTCSNNDGSLILSAAGGNNPYSYSINGGPGQGSAAFNNLVSGNYIAMVTDQDGCTSSINIFVPDEPAPVISAVLTSEVTCFGGLDGIITVNVIGGTNPLQYSLNSGPFQSSNIFPNLLSGAYSVIVRDANGCTATANVNIGQPDVVLSPWSSINSTCGFSNGAVTVNATGGIGTLMYSLNGGPFQLGNTFSNLSAGNYFITVQDGNGCLVVANTSVSNVPGPVIPSVITTDVTCFGGSDGSLIINTNGGAFPLQYSIDNGATYQSDSTFSGLSAGNQTIQVTDANGCTVATNIIINEPLVISPVLNVSGSTCGDPNGSVSINANGGTGTYVFGFNGNPVQPSGLFSNLSAGNYPFIIKDASGCTVNGNVVVGNAPGPVVNSTNVTNILCNGWSTGFIAVATSFGTNPIQYTIVGGPTRPTGNFAGLTAGNYSIIITDANGCTATTSATVTEPPPIVINTVVTGSTCGISNGSVVVNANGGTGAYQYNINAGPYQASGTFNNLTPGNYTIKVKDANGCISLPSVVIITDAPSPLISNVPITNITCFGANTGDISIIAIGGTNPLEYSLNGAPGQISNYFNNLTAGAYAILVTDANGCTAASNVNLSEPSALTLNSATVGSTCSAANGSVTITANGATPGYQYSIDGGHYRLP